MSKKTNGGGGNMLLLAGLGIGAFMLFTNNSAAQPKMAETNGDSNGDGETDIPAAPKILAVNTAASESPLPTGIVSDEEGMEATTNPPRINAAASNASDGDEYEEGSSADSGKVPSLISTRLTPKEKAIIDRGQLTNDLAMQRPDLYKAIYVRKNGKNGNGQKALLAADALIQSIQVKAAPKATPAQKKGRKVKMTLAPNAATMVMAAAQAAGGGGMAAMATTASGIQHKAGGKAPIRKIPLHHPTGSKGAHSQKKAAHKAPAHHPAVKHPAAKHRAGSTHHKPAPHR